MTSDTVPASGVPARRVLLAAAAAALLAGAVAAAVALTAAATGVPMIPQLTPAAVALFAVLGAVVAVLGWEVVRRRAARPRRLLARLVPATLLVSLVPDVALGLLTAEETGWAPVLALASLHLTTAAIVVAVSSRLLPPASARD